MIEPSPQSASQLAQSIASVRGGAISKTSTGFTCRCPAHDDHTPSLSVSDGPDGRVLLHCHAGCSQESVISALRDLGLWHQAKLSAVPIPMTPRGIHRKWKDKTLTRWWEYVSPDGEIKGYTARYDDASGKDVIPYFKFDPKKGWAAGYPDDSPRMLYGLTSLASPGTVWITEGEKAADAVIRRGAACVSSPGGAKAPEKADWGAISGRDVVIWPDFDDPGKGYAKRIIAILRKTDAAIRVVDVERMNPTEPGWDAADWNGTDLVGVPTVTVAEWVKGPITQIDTPEWRLTESGGIKAISHNIVLALEHMPDLKGCLGWDLLTDRAAWRRNPPFLRAHRTAIYDQDAAELAFWLAEQIGTDFKSAAALEAIEVSAARHHFHPVQDYLISLKWDGVPRLDTFLSDAFGVSQTDYHASVGKAFLIGAVARVMRPGCQMDTMLVLMGNQGIGKTSAVRSLLPDFGWYAETTESPAQKDFYQGLRGKWIVEIGELHSFKNADWSKIKQMLSAKMDTYRPSYGHFTKDFLRQCVFIGTTNDDTWNRDPSGARRFWPVRCTESNIEYILSQRDQLWAEAFSRYSGGEAWWGVEQGEEQKSVYEEDAWEIPIRAWVVQNSITVFTAHKVLMDCFGFEVSRYGLKEQNRIAAACRNLGFIHIRKKINGKAVWAWDATDCRY